MPFSNEFTFQGLCFLYPLWFLRKLPYIRPKIRFAYLLVNSVVNKNETNGSFVICVGFASPLKLVTTNLDELYSDWGQNWSSQEISFWNIGEINYFFFKKAPMEFIEKSVPFEIFH